MRTVADFSFRGQKALVRVDFNVPLNKDFSVADDTRIRESLPSIKKILADRGAVILMSHLGRPDGKAQRKYSLKHLVEPLKKMLRCPVHFSSDCIGPQTEKKAQQLKEGEVLLLENLRFHN